MQSFHKKESGIVKIIKFVAFSLFSLRREMIINVLEEKTFCFSKSFEVFVNDTNLTFLSFLYKINIEVSLKNKVASSGTWTHNSDHHWFTSLI